MEENGDEDEVASDNSSTYKSSKDEKGDGSELISNLRKTEKQEDQTMLDAGEVHLPLVETSEAGSQEETDEDFDGSKEEHTGKKRKGDDDGVVGDEVAAMDIDAF